MTEGLERMDGAANRYLYINTVNAHQTEALALFTSNAHSGIYLTQAHISHCSSCFIYLITLLRVLSFVSFCC